MIELYLEKTKVDVDKAFSTLLNYAVSDVKDFGAKKSAFSKTIVLPGSKTNNAAFGHIYSVQRSTVYDSTKANIGFNFNAAVSAKAIVYADNIQVFKGTARLLEIVDYGDGTVDYEVALFGELGGLVFAMGNKRLEDLDFSEYDHDYTAANIVASWSESVSLNCPLFSITAATKMLYVRKKLGQISVGDEITLSGTSSNEGTYTVTEAKYRKGAGGVIIIGTEIKVAETVSDEIGTDLSITLTGAGGFGYYYPLIDYGQYSTDKIDYDIKTFRPALHMKEYLDKIFEGSGYTYESDFLRTPFLKRIIVPCSAKELYKLTTTQLKATLTEGAQLFDGLGGENLMFGSVTGGNFNITAASVFTYTTANTLAVTLKFTLVANYGPNYDNFYVDILQNSTVVKRYTKAVAGSTYGVLSVALEAQITLQQNDVLRVSIYGTSYSPDIGGIVYESVYLTNMYADLAVSTVAVQPVLIQPGDAINASDTIPRGIFQKDFLSSVCKMFNLMVDESKTKSKHLIIKPYVDYYNTDERVDWSDKVDRSKPKKIKPMSELNARFYAFKFKKDNDYYNERYSKIYNEGYGDRVYDNGFEFAKETNNVEVLFSSTPLVKYDGCDKIVPVIMKKNGSTEEAVEHNVRVMQRKTITGVDEWDIKDGATVRGSYTSYGYAGHLDDPLTPSADLNFGAPKEMYAQPTGGTLSNNLFNVYYSPYMAEITDPDSKMVTCTMRLTRKDIADLDLSKPVYIDGSLFRINKIENYNATQEDTCTADLLKIINSVY
jgi:hypothetical protein